MGPEPFGFNVFAAASGNFGLAVAARNSIAMLLGRRVPVTVRDQKVWDGRSGHHHEYDRLAPGPLRWMPWGINLLHLNPDDILARIPLQWAHLPIERRMNVCVPFWELPQLPPAHVRGLAMMDLVLAPSLYIRDAVVAALPDARVEHFPQAVYLPDGIRPDRARWGFAEDEVVFLCAFDVLGDVERKNPWAAVEAFREAFGGSSGARLAVKVANATLDEAARPSIARLRELARRDPNVTLIEEGLGYDDVLSLYASADAVVSLHRAEGLGLVLMEAMSLGKPVISTAWSGTMDFTGEDDACLVGYDLVPVSATHPAYQPESTGHEALTWAEPRLADAVGWMRRLADDPALRAAIGGAAAASMEARREEHRKGAVVDLMRDLYEGFDLGAPQHAEKARLIVAHRRAELSRRATRAPAGLARALGRRLRVKRGTRPTE